MKFGKRWMKPPDSQKLWLYSPREKVADRPHKWTLVIGAVSPFLAIVAVVVSWKSLQTSQGSMEVSQRAYLSFKIETKELTPHPPNSPSPTAEYILKVRLDVTNMGNTPATLDAATYEFAKAHSNTIESQVPKVLKLMASPLKLAPKDLYPVDLRVLAQQNDLRFAHGDYIRLRIVVHWHDAFDVYYTEKWCKNITIFASALDTSVCKPNEE